MNLNFRSNLNLKYALLTTVIMVFLFLSIGMLVYNYAKKELIRNNEAAMKLELRNLTDLLTLQDKERNTSLENALKTADHLLANEYKLGIMDTVSENITITNQVNNDTTNILLKKWNINNDPLYNNHAFVDTIKALTGCTSTIFQKTSKGYVRISTSVLKPDGSRAVATYIPQTSPIVQAIEQGNVYKGRVFVVNDWHTSIYKPIRINGVIEGMLFVGIKEKDFNFLKSAFSEKRFLSTGYAFIINTDGNFIIHPDQEGKNIKETKLGQALLKNKSGIYKGNWPENDEEKSAAVFYNYYQPYEYIIAVCVYDQELYLKPLNKFKFIIFVSLMISLGLSLLGIRAIVSSMTTPVKKVAGLLEDLSKGKSVEKIKENRTDEIGIMINSLNVLIDGLKNYTNFSEQIGKGNFNASFNLLSEEDVLGNSLLEMKQNLEKAAEEDKNRNWTSEGLAHFAEILRKSRDSVEQLTYDVLVYLVKYLNANQGGIFVLNDDDPNNKFLELSSCFAYDKKKYLEKKIEIGQGLLGQAYLEKDSIYITNVPQDYISITSGLGGANPNAILIIPMIVNDEVYGVIELASFYHIEDFKIDFVKKVSENIASTISSVKINQNTIKLLQNSQQLTEEMKSQEEEVRQNMEELQATQEEMNRREAENKKELEDLKRKLAMFEKS